MNSPLHTLGAAAPLPAQRIDAAGQAHVDSQAVLALALPLMANSAVQIVLNLTDMWFIGRISTKSLAAVGAVQWLVVVAVLVLGGAGTAVQTIVAQSYGARRYRRASQSTWTALWAMLCAAPLFVGVGGAAAGAAMWAMLGFFNGTGKPRLTLLITLVTTGANALLNQVFIFNLG